MDKDHPIIQELLRGLSERLGQAIPRVSDGSLLDWSREYLPRDFPLPPSRMHAEMAAELDRVVTDRGERLDFVAPRGGAKSTLLRAYVLRSVVERSERYVLWLSETDRQAKQHLSTIRRELETNTRLAAEYPAACGRGSPWNQDRTVSRNGVELGALGMGGAVRGLSSGSTRPTLVVIDDPEGRRQATSAVERRRAWEWLTEDLLPVGGPDTNFVAAGTVRHRDCMVLRLRRTPGWSSKFYRSVEGFDRLNWPLWKAWEAILFKHDDPDREEAARAFFDVHRAEMERGASVLWPDLEDLYSLMLLRAAQGNNAWQLEKQGNPVNPELVEWPEEYFGEDIWFEEWPKNLTVRALFLDPSKGKDAKRGDYSAIVWIGRGRDRVLYVEADLARRPVDVIVSAAVERAALFQPDTFGLEGNAFQDLLGDDLLEEGRLRAYDVPLALVNNYVNKAVRIRRLGPFLSQRLMKFRSGSPSTALLVDQLRDFPLADHDDGPDALEGAIRIAVEAFNGRYAARALRADGLGSRMQFA